MCCTRLAANAGPKKVTKNRHLGTIPQLCQAISSQLRHVSTIGKKLVNSNISSTCPHNMVNFGPLAAEIVSLVWGTRANFNGFGVLAVLLHGILVVGVSQTLRRWAEGATYIWRATITLGIGPHSSWKKMFLISLNPTSSCGTALTLGYAVWRAIEQLVYCHKIQDIEHLNCYTAVGKRWAKTWLMVQSTSGQNEVQWSFLIIETYCHSAVVSEWLVPECVSWT